MKESQVDDLLNVLYAGSGTGVQKSQGVITGQLKVEPLGIESESHKQLTRQVGMQNKKRPKIKEIQSKSDPEKDQEAKNLNAKTEEEARKTKEREQKKNQRKTRKKSDLSRDFIEPTGVYPYPCHFISHAHHVLMIQW